MENLSGNCKILPVSNYFNYMLYSEYIIYQKRQLKIRHHNYLDAAILGL